MSDRLVVHGRTAPLALASTGAGDTSAGRRSAPRPAADPITAFGFFLLRLLRRPTPLLPAVMPAASAAAETDRQMEALRIELERLLDEARHG